MFKAQKTYVTLLTKKKYIRSFFTSSVAVYGLSGINANEDSPINPFNNYGRTKHEAELIYDSWQREDPGVTQISYHSAYSCFRRRKSG